MSGSPSNLGKFWQELKRRKVIRRNMVYAASGFVLLELVSIIAEPFGLPEWTLKLVFIILCIGFVISIILSWFYDFTPDGLVRIKSTDTANDLIPEKPSMLLAWKIATFISMVTIVGLLVFNILRGGNQLGDLTELEKSIAVLLFDNLSGDAATEPFTKGIHDDILTQLSKIRALKVIARTSMERLDPTLSIPEIGTKLGVAAVREGGVQRAGDRVRINVQLSDCQTEAHFWAEPYDRELTAANIFAIQSEIAKTVADALRATLSPEEQGRLATVPTENLAAYDAYLLGKLRMAKETIASMLEAINYFEQAIELDPDFALAYVGLADAYTWQSVWGSTPRQETLAKAQAVVDKALALDDGLGEA